MNITKSILLSAVFASTSVEAQPISIPGSQFPIVSTPSNYFRLIGVDTNGGRSVFSNTKSNFTIRMDDLASFALNSGQQTTNLQVVRSDFLPKSILNGGVGQIGYAGPWLITNTLSYGFTNLHVFDNLLYQNGGSGIQLEIIGLLDGHTARVHEIVQNSNPLGLGYMPAPSNYDVYINSANLYDVNGPRGDTLPATHGAITSDGGIGLATGAGGPLSSVGWSYGLRIIAATNSWRVYDTYLSSLYGGGLNFEIGGCNSANPLFIAAMAPYESLSVLPDGEVNIRGGITNRFDDTIRLWKNAKVYGDTDLTNGTVSVAKSLFLPKVNLSGRGQLMYAGPYTLTNTISDAFTNLNVFDNLVWGVNDQVEVIQVLNAHTVRVFEDVQNSAPGLFYIPTPTNYAVYYNSANTYDVNAFGAHQGDYAGPFTHGSITSDGGFGVATGMYDAGWGNGLRITGGTNSWRIQAVDLSGVGGPALSFLAGGCNLANPFAISTLAPFESLDIVSNGNVKVKYGLTLETNFPPDKAWTGGGMFYWNSNGANLYLLKSSLVNSNWISTNLIN